MRGRFRHGSVGCATLGSATGLELAQERNVNKVWFVWLRGLRGPTAEIWRAHLDVYRNRSDARVLGFRELTEAEAREPLSRLVRKYPAPPQKDD